MMMSKKQIKKRKLEATKYNRKKQPFLEEQKQGVI